MTDLEILELIDGLDDRKRQQWDVLTAINRRFWFFVPGAKYQSPDTKVVYLDCLTVHCGIEKWLELQCRNDNAGCIRAFVSVALDINGPYAPILISEAYRNLAPSLREQVRLAVLSNDGQTGVDAIELLSADHHFADWDNM